MGPSAHGLVRLALPSALATGNPPRRGLGLKRHNPTLFCRRFAERNATPICSEPHVRCVAQPPSLKLRRAEESDVYSRPTRTAIPALAERPIRLAFERRATNDQSDAFSRIFSRALARFRRSFLVRLTKPLRAIFSRSGSISSVISCSTLI
jgi:hypothetical protein